MLKVHEFTAPSGELSAMFLRAQGATLWLTASDGELLVPPGALPAVMARYGAPFDPSAGGVEQGTLALGEGASLRHVRHLAGYDVIARDYLVYEERGQTPLCVMATTVVAALRHLALAAAKAAR